MDDRNNGAGFGRIDVLGSVPGSSSGTSLGFAITDNTSNDEIRLVHDSTIGYTEGITEFATFVNGTGSFGINVALKVNASKILSV
jgi:hypothetical protein